MHQINASSPTHKPQSEIKHKADKSQRAQELNVKNVI